MPLTVKEIQNATPTGKVRKLFDGGGLYLEITAGGSKLWRIKYRVGGSERRLSLGRFPEVTLKEARDQRDKIRRQLRDGIDPAVQRQAVKASQAAQGDTFEVVAREWYELQAKAWVPSHGSRVIRRLEKDIFPVIGRRPLAEVTAPEVLKALRAIERRGAVETAHRAAQNVGQVFRYGVATGRCERDPSADLRGALAPVATRHHPAVTDPRPLAELLRAIDAYEGQPVTAWALRLAPLLFVRPGELRQAEWAEVDLEGATWVIPGAKMKGRKTEDRPDHVVPLARQAVEILREAEALTGTGRYVFPSLRSASRPMSNNTLNAALRRLGYSTEDMTAHGFRATARTVLDEVLHERPDIIEAQLAHRVLGPLGRAYNRTAYLAERRAMMQRWADFLDELKAGAKVVPLRGMA